MGTPTCGDYVELLFTRLERFRQHEAVTLKISDPPEFRGKILSY